MNKVVLASLKGLVLLQIMLIGACAVTGSVDDRVYIGDGVINLQDHELDDYTCRQRLMQCDVLSVLSRRCRCLL